MRFHSFLKKYCEFTKCNWGYASCLSGGFSEVDSFLRALLVLVCDNGQRLALVRGGWA